MARPRSTRELQDDAGPIGSPFNSGRLRRNVLELGKYAAGVLGRASCAFVISRSSVQVRPPTINNLLRNIKGKQSRRFRP